MRIGLLTTSFPRAEADVPGQFVLGFARALADLGQQIEVLAPEPAEAPYLAKPRFPEIELNWVRYLEPRSLQRTFYGAGVLDNLRTDPLASLGLVPFVVALARAMQARVQGWDAVVSHWALPCALVAGALRGTRRHLAVLHSADVFLLERLPGRRALAQRIAGGADALVFASRDLRGRFLKLLGPLARGPVAARAHVCAMGIPDLPPLARGRCALRAERGLEGFTLLSLGRLIPLKGVEHAIAAVAQRPEVELVVAGDGPARPALEAQARSTGARVRFVGEQQGADKHAWFASADGFVLPSIVLANGRTEGMPTTLLEAMQHGLPVIASDVGGVRDVVRPGENGMLVAPGRPAEIAAALDGLADPARRSRLATGARETAEMYAWSALGPRFLQLLAPEGNETGGQANEMIGE